MAFNNYLEDENDKPYFTTNSLAYYYDKMEGFAKAVEGSAKALNLTKEEVEKRLTLYIEQNKNELDLRLKQWDEKLGKFDSSVETLLSEWVDDGTLTHVIDSSLIDQRLAPVTAQLAETANTFVNVMRFGTEEEMKVDCHAAFQAGINYLSERGGGTLIIPNLGFEYIFKAESPTIENPKRVEIRSDNITITGAGNPKIYMTGVTAVYLSSFQDYMFGSGRDVFTVFSFIYCDNCHVSGISFRGDYTGAVNKNYGSPRAKAVGFIGATNCSATKLYGKGIIGNLLNATNSYIEYDAPYRRCENITWTDSIAVHCQENGFNFMGGVNNAIGNNLNATLCSNGLENGANGFTLSNANFRKNRSSGLALSGYDQVISNLIACESVTVEDGVDRTDKGYGVVITGGGRAKISGSYLNDNKAHGIYIYSGVKDVKFTDVEIKRNSKDSYSKVVCTINGTADKKVENISFVDCDIDCQDDVVISFPKHANNVRFINNRGKLQNVSSAITFDATCEKSVAVGNRFNKLITMNDPTGEAYNNGIYKTVDRSNLPTTGSWRVGDIINNPTAFSGREAQWRCTSSGTLGTLNGGATTGSVAAGTNELTVNSLTGLYVGAWVIITGVAGVKMVDRIEGNIVFLDSNADVSVTNAAISYRTPSFTVSQQNGPRTSISAAPEFIGQMAIANGIVYFSISTTNTSGWKAVTT